MAARHIRSRRSVPGERISDVVPSDASVVPIRKLDLAVDLAAERRSSTKIRIDPRVGGMTSGMVANEHFGHLAPIQLPRPGAVPHFAVGVRVAQPEAQLPKSFPWEIVFFVGPVAIVVAAVLTFFFG